MSFAMRRFCRSSREFINYAVSNSKRWNSTTATKAPGGFSKTVLTGVGFGVLIGSGYAYYTLKYDNQNTQAISIDEALLQKSITAVTSLPNVEFARQIKIPADSSGLEVVLFQYPTCPFCCKVRAFLDFYGISYNVVEVNPVLRQQIKWSNYKKVPILLVGNGKEYVQMNDSSMIVSGLMTFLKNKDVDIVNMHEYYPLVTDSNNKNANVVNKYFVMHGGLSKSDLQKDKEERAWRQWADEVLVHTLSPNVYRTKEEALQAFNWFSEVGEWERLFSNWERLLVVYVGAYAMYYIGKRLKKRHNLKDNVRESLYDECRTWIKEVDKRGRFFGGKSPNLADLAVYGVLSSIEGCQAFKELLDNTKLGTWFYEMKKAVQSHAGMNSLR